MNKKEFTEKLQELTLLVGNFQTKDFFALLCDELLTEIREAAKDGERSQEVLEMTYYLKRIIDIQMLFLTMEKAEVMGEMGFKGQA